jgi:hypothetical protein
LSSADNPHQQKGAYAGQHKGGPQQRRPELRRPYPAVLAAFPDALAGEKHGADILQHGGGANIRRGD